MVDVPAVTIECFYSCHKCGLKKVSINVPARDPQDEDVVRFVEQTAAIMSADHAKRSPDCHPQVLNDVMIPMPEHGVGMAARH